MALRVDNLKLVGRKGQINLGEKRLGFAGVLGERVQLVIEPGVIKLYSERARLCKACGGLIELEPDERTPHICNECIARAKHYQSG